MNDVMRFTVVEPSGTVSFVAPCTVLEALVAACTHAPQSLNALLGFADSFAPGLQDRMSSGLAVFDEHNSRENFQAIRGALEYYQPRDVPVFRVVDERTRDASLQSVRAGVVVFNLIQKRIVQIQNTYNEIQRKGRVQVQDASAGTRRVQKYELPANWTLVPGR